MGARRVHALSLKPGFNLSPIVGNGRDENFRFDEPR
jgi:hypothetical protein